MGPAMTAANRHLRDFRGNIDRARNDMRKFDQSTDTTTRGLGRLGSRLDQVRGKVNAIRGPTDAAGRSLRNLDRDSNRLSSSLARLDRRVHQNRESLAKFDNELRGMRILVIASQLQALSTAVIGLGNQLIALAGSAGVAATAIGGTLVAATAQAIPAIGLLAAAIFRVKQVTDVLQQIQLAQKQSASQATSATNKQADSVDKLTTANETLVDAQRGVQEAHRGVSQAIADQRRELEDLILAQKSASLQEEESVDRLRQLRATGVTGFELRGAELDVEQNRVGARRARQDLTAARTGTPEGVRTALRQLDDADRALARARRGLGNAQRDSTEAGIASVGAARQLQFLRKQLSDAENALVDSIGRLRTTWKRVARPVTDIIIESFTRATDEAEKAIQRPSLIRAFENLATKASRQIDRISGFAFSDRSIAFLERTTKRLADNLQPAGTAALRLSRAFMNISDAAAPVLHRLIEDFARFTGRIERFTENDQRLREIFEFGEQQLHLWLRLAGAVGRLLVALVAPGGNAGFGAAVSGARTLEFLISEIERAIRWINDNPVTIGEHFADSEQIFRRLWQLLLEIGKIMLELFDPESVDTFADAVELMLPALQQAAETFGLLTRLIVGFLQIPGVKQLFETGLGFVIFLRLGGRFRALFTGLIGDLTGFLRGLFTANARIGAMATTTGGLVARWEAGTAAVNAYTASVGRAAGVTAGAAARAGGAALPAGVVFRRGRYINTATGREVLPPGAGGPGAAVVGGAAAGGGLLGRLGGGAGRLAGGAARLLGPTALLLGGIGALTTPGNIGERLQGGANLATFGLFPGLRTTDERLKTILERMRDVKGELTLKDITKDWGDFNDEQQRTIRQAMALHNAQVKVKEQFRDLFPKQDIINMPLFKQALERIADLRENGAENLKDLRNQMRITANFLADSAEKGSRAWRSAMITHFSAGIDSVLDLMRDGKIGVKNGMEEITRISRRQMQLVRGHMKNLSADARDALSENFRTARVRAERQLGRLEDATGRSLKTLKALMGNELASYGFTSTEVRRIIRAKQDPEDFTRGSRTTEGTSQGPIRTPAIGGFGARFMRPMGGFIGAMGERGQDAIHTLLGRGEAVLNWGQQKIVEPALNAAYGFGLTELFKKTKGFHAGTGTGGYARGGIPIVPVPGFPGEQANRAILDEIAFVTKRFGLRLTDAYGPGHQSPGHTIYGTAADFSGPDRSMNAAVKFLASRYKVLYDGRFGSTAWPGHGPSTVAGSNAHLHVEFGTKDLAAATGNAKPFSIPRVEVIGAGTTGEIANVGLAQVRRGIIRAARRAIRRSLMAGTEGAEMGAGPAPPGQLRSWLRRALQITHHMSPGNLSALYGRAMQESGGDPRAINRWDSNAAAGHPSQGLLQTIPSTFAAYSLPGMKNILNPIHNAVAAIRYMYATYGHIVGPSSSGYAAGGELPGPLGRAKMIVAHGKEWILNEGQKNKVAGWLGTSVGSLRDRLGFTGGPSSAQGGAEADKLRPIFDQQDFLGNRLQPLDFAGLARIIRALFEHMQLLNKKGKDTFKNVNENIDQLTREGGLLDQIDVAIERAVENMATRATFLRFRRGNVIRSTRGEPFEARAELNTLRRSGRLLNRENRFVGRALGSLDQRIGRIRRGGVDEDEEGVLADLLTQRRNLSERRRGIRSRLAENIRARFDAQQQVIETALERDLQESTQGLQANELARRISQAFGRGGEINFIDVQMNLLKQQVPILQAAMEKARAQGNNQLADQLQGQIQDIDGQIAELTAQRMQVQIDELEKRFGRADTALNLRERLLTAFGAVGLASGRGGIFAERGQLLEQKRNELIALRAQAALDGNTGAVDTLTEQIDELGVQIVENTAALFQARIEDVNRAQGVTSNLSGTRTRILELQRELGIITPAQAQAAIREQLEIQRNALLTQQAGLQQLLNEATAAGNEQGVIDLTQALADNELALLENTQSVKELDGSLSETQSFSSTAWQWYRTAVFNGSGGLLPQFTPPIGFSGLPMPAATGTWGTGGGGEGSYQKVVGVEHMEITQNETVDYVALGSKIAWDVNTPTV